MGGLLYCMFLVNNCFKLNVVSNGFQFLVLCVAGSVSHCVTNSKAVISTGISLRMSSVLMFLRYVAGNVSHCVGSGTLSDVSDSWCRHAQRSICSLLAGRFTWPSAMG